MATASSLLSRFRAIYFPASRTFTHRTFSVRPYLSPQLRPLVSVSDGVRFMIDCRSSANRCFSTRPTTSSIQDPSPNWSNRPPKETILLDGCDFEHWLVVVEKPDENLTRDEIIDSYIKTLAQVVGSDEEARMKIYSVSTKHYFAFGALVSEELSYKLKALTGVRWVLPDSYLDVRNKDYGGEPFINGQAVPYDPKYHEEWVRNNARANERSRRQDRPRNYDRTRNFERRRENMQSRDFQNREVPMPNFQNTVPNPSSSPAQPELNVPPQNPGQQVPSSPNAFPSQIPNPQPGYGYQAGPPGSQNHQSVPPGQGHQSGPPGQGHQSGAPGHAYQPGPPSQGYQSGPPGQGYQSGPPGQGYQSGPPGQGYQSGRPGQGYQSGPPGQGFQGSMSGNQGYQSTPPPGQGYNAGPLGGHGYQAGPPVSQGYQGGPQGGQAYQGNQPIGAGYQGGPPGGQAYQPNQSSGTGYQSSPPRSPVYQPSSSAPYHGGNQQTSPGGQNGGSASPGYLQGGNNGFQGGNNQSGAAENQGVDTINTARDIPGRDF